ncbi:class I SAM-dependent methyltransferase [Actinoplanes sp. NEAU-A12]|uniref:Class I SAM-dependent methyltransferase n=1 Tax=Actinoplanes sandaracinus TaxID=3045177 RepID=A0ABT6WQT3_9ACTN|nr:class I SAM-dependent methyltransferase [Actinoplanes sandaracinus]MDI6102093.1 class I SAM-dependent methyltransferase [Actinoplanes sandaracinus]
MDDTARQAHYWNTAGATKTFTHPLHGEWLAGLSHDSRILDYGCGYGRVTAELSDLGFTRVRGVDPSPALIARGRASRPDLDFAVVESPPAVDRPAAGIDVVVLFAVLTCVPDDQAQRALVAELRRVLAPDGLIYVSDLLLQSDRRNQRRYAAHAERGGGPYGVFETDDGAVCRHHDIAWLRSLFADFEPVDERRIDVATMNGRPARGVQMLARRR